MEKRILIELIVSCGMTQKRIAIKSGYSEAQLSSWVSGKRKPKLFALKRIAVACGYDLEIGIKKLP